MHVEYLFFELSLIIIIAAILAIIAKFLKQPIILAYIATGVLLGPFFFNIIKAPTVLEMLSTIGITFLLFLVGMQLDPKKLKEIGKISTLVGLGQIIFTAAFGYIIARSLKFELVPALYIAIALTFSSTIIALKMLSEKREIESMHGKLSIGILLVQDFVAVIVLIILNGISAQRASLDYMAIVLSVVKSVLFLIFALSSGKFILQPIFKKIARSQELLFITSISWCLLFSVIAIILDFPIEIGAFLAGISLASLPYSIEIHAKIKPLRDFFITLFFVALGSQVLFTSLQESYIPLIIFSLFVIIGNPLIILIILGIYGYRVRTGFKTAVILAQVSEFSFIISALGYKIGDIDQNIVSIIAITGIITITVSTYMIEHDEKLFKLLKKPLKFFQRKKPQERVNRITRELKDHIVILGYDKMGKKIVESFKRRQDDILVVDYNPNFINYLTEQGIDALYGDIKNEDILENAKLSDAQMIISTVPYFDVSVAILNYYRKNDLKATIIVTANNAMDCIDLYKHGADYVLFPYSISADYFVKMLRQDIKSKRSKHITELKKLLRVDLKPRKKIVEKKK